MKCSAELRLVNATGASILQWERVIRLARRGIRRPRCSSILRPAIQFSRSLQYRRCGARDTLSMDTMDRAGCGTRQRVLGSIRTFSLFLTGRALGSILKMATDEYTCPMHPQIVRDAPGICPICGMALEPRTVSSEEEKNPELESMSRRFWMSLVLASPLVLHSPAKKA